MNKLRQLLLCLLLSPMLLQAQASIYTNDMEYVLADVKQAFIKNKITNVTRVNALLKGFATLQVNGIRIPIFAEGLEPNKQALDYFYSEAVKAGFHLFANPVHWNGGQRVANGVFEEYEEEFGGPVINDPDKTQALIDRIVAFDKEYPDLKWINPFNEDGSPDGIWSASQMTTIYKTLSESSLNAELIGACSWGIPAAIKIIKNTDIEKYITVSTTHNLGLHHDSWPEFINLSKAAGLPVWDSETTHNADLAANRLGSALANKVDGLVLYNIWAVIDLGTGEVNNAGRVLMSHYLKPSAIDISLMDDTHLFDIYSEESALRLEFISPLKHHEVTVLDINGKTRKQYASSSEGAIMLNGLAKSVYVVLVQTKNEVQREKAIVY